VEFLPACFLGDVTGSRAQLKRLLTFARLTVVTIRLGSVDLSSANCKSRELTRPRDAPIWKLEVVLMTIGNDCDIQSLAESTVITGD
jgi:hypothetical protein